MISYVNAAGFACELASAVCLIVNEIKQRKNAERLDTIGEMITSIESEIPEFESMEPAPGLELAPGVSFDFVRDTMIAGMREGVGKSKKKLLEAKREIEASSRIPLAIVALILLVTGVSLHVIEALTAG